MDLVQLLSQQQKCCEYCAEYHALKNNTPFHYMHNEEDCQLCFCDGGKSWPHMANHPKGCGRDTNNILRFIEIRNTIHNYQTKTKITWERLLNEAQQSLKSIRQWEDMLEPYEQEIFRYIIEFLYFVSQMKLQISYFIKMNKLLPELNDVIYFIDILDMVKNKTQKLTESESGIRRLKEFIQYTYEIRIKSNIIQ